MTDEHRRTDLVGNLGAVRSRIAQACEAAGRDTSSVTLIAVTKTYPAEDVLTLAQLGVHDVGESKDQEAKAKIREIATHHPRPELRWHLVGRLQTNKARSVASYAFAVHSVDRKKIVTALADGVAAELAAGSRQTPVEVFVQVSLDGDPERGGATRKDLPELADAVAARPELALRGVMAVAPLGVEPDVAFADLATIADRLRDRHPAADAISAGMSHDLDAAVRHGATHLRIGTALLGQRPPLIS
jgi:pyridoxal phosphate enzyme (YggS family)